MELTGGGHVVHGKGQVRVLAAVVIGLHAPLVPSELELEVALVVAHEDDLPGAVLGALATLDLEAERLLVERDGLVAVEHVDAVVHHLCAHVFLPCRCLSAPEGTWDIVPLRERGM